MIKVLKVFSLVTVFVWSLPTMAATSCSAGYYLSGSTCVICPAGYYCTNSKKTACTGTTYSDTQGASSCKTCPTAVYLKDKVSFYHYWTDDDMHDTIGGCHVFLKDTYVVNGSVESGSMICYIGSDNDYGATRNVCQILLSKIKCNAGYWNFQYQQQYAFYSDFNEMINFMCDAVEPGYYSPEGALTRTACPDGETTTGYGVGADEINDCGYDLVLGDSKLHLRRAQRTNPSLQVLHNGKVYYGDATPANNKGKLRILYNDTIYSVYDDTM